MFQLLQAGEGETRDLVLIHYLATPETLAAKIKAAAPGACILVDTQTPTVRYTRLGSGGADGILSLSKAKDRARQLAGPFTVGRTLAAGFSAGGQGVKTWLDAGQLPDAAVICDGWHASTIPGPLRSRRGFVARALLGEAVLCLSHTQILPPTFLSTKHVAELLTGWTLDRSGPPDAPELHQEAGLRVESYRGDTGTDHMHQAGVVFPHLLEQAFVLLDRLQLGPGAPPRDHSDCPLGDLALRLSLGELRDGVHEEPDGTNTGPRLRPYFAGVARGTGEALKLLHLSSMLWCSAGAGWAAWTAWAKKGGPMPPHGWRAAVAECVTDARAPDALDWHPIGDDYLPKRGDLAVFGRAGGSPSKGGTGHIARLLEGPGDDGRFRTLGANEENSWKLTGRTMSDRELEGFISYP